jgi:hypothetical protein
VRRFRRWWNLYLAIGFIVLIPVMSYKIIAMGMPTKLLLIVIPGYLILSCSFFYGFKSLSKSK